jgi:hypothetical protein
VFIASLAAAGEWRLSPGDARGADSLARSAAAIDTVALERSALAGRAELLSARALVASNDVPNARGAAERAVKALANGYGPSNAWTRSARLLADSLRK